MQVFLFPGPNMFQQANEHKNALKSFKVLCKLAGPQKHLRAELIILHVLERFQALFTNLGCLDCF